MWPFRRRDQPPPAEGAGPTAEFDPAPAAASNGGAWAGLPVVARTFDTMPSTFKIGAAVKEDLVALDSPRFVGPMTHLVSASGPSGLVQGLATTVDGSGTGAYAGSDTLALRIPPQPHVPPARRPLSVQAMMTGVDVPPAGTLPDVVPAEPDWATPHRNAPVTTEPPAVHPLVEAPTPAEPARTLPLANVQRSVLPLASSAEPPPARSAQSDAVPDAIPPATVDGLPESEPAPAEGSPEDAPLIGESTLPARVSDAPSTSRDIEPTAHAPVAGLGLAPPIQPLAVQRAALERASPSSAAPSKPAVETPVSPQVPADPVVASVSARTVQRMALDADSTVPAQPLAEPDAGLAPPAALVLPVQARTVQRVTRDTSQSEPVPGSAAADGTEAGAAVQRQATSGSVDEEPAGRQTPPDETAPGPAPGGTPFDAIEGSPLASVAPEVPLLGERSMVPESPGAAGVEPTRPAESLALVPPVLQREPLSGPSETEVHASAVVRSVPAMEPDQVPLGAASPPGTGKLPLASHMPAAGSTGAFVQREADVTGPSLHPAAPEPATVTPDASLAPGAASIDAGPPDREAPVLAQRWSSDPTTSGPLDVGATPEPAAAATGDLSTALALAPRAVPLSAAFVGPAVRLSAAGPASPSPAGASSVPARSLPTAAVVQRVAREPGGDGAQAPSGPRPVSSAAPGMSWPASTALVSAHRSSAVAAPTAAPLSLNAPASVQRMPRAASPGVTRPPPVAFPQGALAGDHMAAPTILRMPLAAPAVPSTPFASGAQSAPGRTAAAALAAGVATLATDGSLVFAPPASEPAVQRAVPDDPASAPATSVDAPAPAAPAPSPAAAAGTGGGGEDLDELARKLYDRIRWRLRTELRLDMERAGRGAGLRR